MDKILIVDDSSLARTFVIRCFEVAGVTADNFVEASDGAKALDYINNNEVSLVVSDLNMPNIDGAHLSNEIKANKKSKHIPIVIITSAGSDEQVEELKEIGVNVVMSKPISPNDIIDNVLPLINMGASTNDY